MAVQARFMNTSPFEVRLRLKRHAVATKPFELDVDFQLAPGITILFEPSVAGKSTFLYCISGLLKPQSARIVLQGQVLHDSAAQIFLPPQLRGLAYLFQSPALFPHLTAHQNVAFGIHNLPAEERILRIQNLLDAFRVAHLAERKPG